jgi:lipoprotein-releasing system ATP-binding protein
MTPIITADAITKAYRTSDSEATTSVLKGASLTVQHGEVVALMGPSGAGKSTLLHILATLETFDSGSLKYAIDDRQIDLGSASTSTVTSLRHSSIGIVFQFHHLLPEFTAHENVMMPGLLRGDREADVAQRADELLASVGMMHRRDHMPRELSGGEQQRVAIARALVNRPSVLFADEPTGNLDQEHAEAVADLLVGLSTRNGTACVIATHSVELAQRAHRIVRMVDGRCVEDLRG